MKALYVGVIAAAIGAGAALGWGESAEAVSCTEDFVYYSYPRSADGNNCYGLGGVSAWSISGDTWTTRNVSAYPVWPVYFLKTTVEGRSKCANSSVWTMYMSGYTDGYSTTYVRRDWISGAHAVCPFVGFNLAVRHRHYIRWTDISWDWGNWITWTQWM